MDFATLATTANTKWELHQVYRDYHTAFCDLGFFKNQGYLSVQIKMKAQDLFEIHVLKSR